MQPNPNEPVRVHIWVKGRVQGVGFRAHVEYSARQIGGLSGWVRNVGDDTVEAIAEGQREQVERLIEAMKQGPRMSRVDEAKIDWESPTGEYNGFRVKSSA
ncbi:MAG TPA: acylphosphatase [Anaerolineales bacterium]|mgnify:FL=1|nr:acylphosphatase [Anaerolineales bacterium]HNB40275.1 acylphosphatase [Anaerolineales bacterium]HND49953.1 acylphosphatase [Anaerolineales bacterium]HNE03907.1 acylphosphatase [Anaerolineales bacterium]HNF93314.1 acylphosphatase [Anaerolineales bacterium]